jgi:hypothetical protein
MVALPSVVIVGRDGVAVKNENGKLKYKKAANWLDKQRGREFSDKVLEIIQRKCPEMLGAHHDARYV